MPSSPIPLLVVEPDLRRATQIAGVLSRARLGAFNLRQAQSLVEAEEMLRSEPCEVIVTRVFLPDASGHEALLRFRELGPDAVVLALLEDDEKGVVLGDVQSLSDECLFYKDLSDETLVEAVRLSIDRREMLRELRTRQANAVSGKTPFRALLNYMDEALFLVSSPEGELLFANEVADAWFPDSKEETLKELFEYGVLGCAAIEIEIVTGNGLVPNAELRSVEIEWRERRCCMITLRNISKRKRAEEAYKASQRRLELTLKASNIGLWSWDLRSNQFQFSGRWKQQLGYDSHDYPNTLSAFRKAMHPEDRGRVVSSFRDALRGKPGDFEIEYRMRHKDGSYRHILCRAEVFPDAEGRLASVLGTHIDVSDRRFAEERSLALSRAAHGENGLVAKLASRLEQVTVDLGEKARQIRSHFRNDSEIVSSLRELELLSRRIARMKEFLELRPQSELVCEGSFDVGEVLAENRERIVCLLPAKVELELDIQEAVELVGLAPALFQLALSEATLCVGERVSAEFKSRLLIRAFRETRQGEYQARSCLEFVYAGSEIDRDELAALLTLPGISVYTSDSGGLAILKLTFGRPAVQEPLRSSPSALVKKKPLALLAEDEGVLKMAIQTMLEALDYEVVVASDGAAAVDAFFQSPKQFDLALVDLRMPEIDGDGVLASIRSSSPQLPVIKMSGDDEGWSKQAFGIEDSYSRFLLKPFGVPELRAAISELTNRAQARM